MREEIKDRRKGTRVEIGKLGNSRQWNKKEKM